MPTVLDLLGVAAPDQAMMGQSLVPLLKGESLPVRGALLESRLAVRKDANLEAYVDDRWKIIVEIPKKSDWSGEGPRPERTKTLLFDRQKDPDELHDVSRENPEVVERMTARLDDALRAAREAAKLYDAAADQKLDLSEEEIENLRQLGYVDDE